MMKPPIVVAALGVLAAVAYSAYRHRRSHRPVSSSEDPFLQRWEGEGGQAVARERPDTRFASEGGAMGHDEISFPAIHP